MHFRTLSRIWIEYQIFYNNLNGQFISFLQLHLLGTIYTIHDIICILLLLEEFRVRT